MKCSKILQMLIATSVLTTRMTGKHIIITLRTMPLVKAAIAIALPTILVAANNITNTLNRIIALAQSLFPSLCHVIVIVTAYFIVLITFLSLIAFIL